MENEQLRGDGMTFYECLMFCATTPELVGQFDRLQGANLSMRGSALDLMIDKAAGRQDAELAAFTDFVYECIWTRLAAVQNKPQGSVENE